MAEKLHGHCKYFVTPSSNSAANNGYCNAITDKDGLPLEINIYGNASECAKFEELDRIRTNISEFSWDETVRAQRGFDER